MQKLAAYLLERTDGMNWPEVRASETSSLRAQVENWLRSKGAPNIVSQGQYRSEDGSAANFEVQEAADGERSWWMVRLEEISDDGRRFVAAVSLTSRPRKVSLYATLEVGSDETLVSPFPTDPKCPRVIRTILKAPGRWHHGFSELVPLRRVVGFESGEALVGELKHPERTVPYVLLSEDGNALALPSLDSQLAYDLAGLANVVVLDADATWALTDHFGGRLSCFGGAVRLFWPRLELSDNPYRHPLWTADRLRSVPTDSATTLTRFRRQLRTLVMGASALSVVRPPEIDDIRGAAARRDFAAIRDKARSLEDLAALADLYAKANDDLRGELAKVKADLQVAQNYIAELEGDKAALLANLRATMAATGSPMAPEEITPDAPPSEDGYIAPADGDIRFYKKRFAAPTHDVLIRVNDCGHNRWQNAHAADKARKGVEKLENGRADWKTLEHCGKCQGGGMWRVRW